MRLTAEVIDHSCSFVNAIKDRELDLRSNKIPAIENLGATKDIHDTIDLTDNDIRKLENFPSMPRLKHIYLSNNRLSKIESGLSTCIPNIQTLILQNNMIEDIADLEPLRELKHLKYLSLVGNPVTKKPNYRMNLISILPQLKALDFQVIKAGEREEALSSSSVSDGATGAGDTMTKKAKVFEPGENLMKRDQKEIDEIKMAIKNAKSLEEVTKLERQLRTGRK